MEKVADHFNGKLMLFEDRFGSGEDELISCVALRRIETVPFSLQSAPCANDWRELVLDVSRTM